MFENDGKTRVKELASVPDMTNEAITEEKIGVSRERESAPALSRTENKHFKESNLRR
jgi:hypothetical protein